MTTETLIAAAAHELLAQLMRAGIHVGSGVSISIQDHISFTELTISAKSLIASQPDSEPSLSQPVNSVDDCILEVAGIEPVTITKLARLAGYSYSQWFRERVNALVEQGFLKRTSKGIART